jgi:DNA-binding NarL/FixJ family response regulator
MEEKTNPQAQSSIRVIIADNHSLVRQSIKIFLMKASDIEVIGEARDGYESVQLTKQLAPDVLVIDVDMLYVNGLQVIEQIRRLGLATRVVILSTYNDETLLRQALQHGASSYLSKDLIPAELLPAVRVAYEGQVYQSYYHQLSNWGKDND